MHSEILTLKYLLQVEYDLEHSSKNDLVLLSVIRIEQSAIPMAMTWYPPLTKESFILLVNNEVNPTVHMHCQACVYGVTM